jgi:hypothetical protein
MQPGDKLTITISGKIATRGTDVSIRKNRYSLIADPWGLDYVPSNMEVLFTLDSNASFTVTHESQYKNGVHIDAKGLYWMRRPDGWHRMRINPDPPIVPEGEPTLPVERLREAKDKPNA